MAPRDKLLEPVAGVPLLRDRARAALSTGALVVVTLPPDRPARRATISDLALRIITVADASDGMGGSIAAGVAVTPEAQGVMILPADMPDIGAAEIRLLIDVAEREPGLIHRGASGGKPGHPVLFPAELRPELLSLSGDEGARAVIRRYSERVRLHPLPGRAALTDLDTPEAWRAWRSRAGT